ncbi:MAG: hypothetical protein Q4E47_02615 [Candidatus Saccharibacteria bacterium]|nr:hypothetical protein [Candidatus Saccharibacteria bacterium]
MRKLISILLSAVLLATPVFAVDLSDDQKGAISMGCSSIKNSLSQLQKADAASRSRIGTTYQTILTSYLTPMNLRLVKNGKLTTDLTSFVNDFTTTRANFNAQYVSYSRSLEELIAVDCQNNPDEFYEKLEHTREERAKLSSFVSEINKTLDAHMVAVSKLRSGRGQNV